MVGGKFHRMFACTNNIVTVQLNSVRCIPPATDNYYGRPSTWPSSNYHGILNILSSGGVQFWSRVAEFYLGPRFWEIAQNESEFRSSRAVETRALKFSE